VDFQRFLQKPPLEKILEGNIFDLTWLSIVLGDKNLEALWEIHHPMLGFYGADGQRSNKTET
jgi:hypothetical protein